MTFFVLEFQLRCTILYTYVPGSSVGRATDYGLDGPGSNTGGAHPASCKMGTVSFLGVTWGRACCWTLTLF